MKTKISRLSYTILTLTYCFSFVFGYIVYCKSDIVIQGVALLGMIFSSCRLFLLAKLSFENITVYGS